ncbi:hypothetical protein NUW58_g8942 [Xylaria curta]|uniref:Uncharacterized protein n=1 Tax=Xylaria curta TaxID=42375 RepID=A0ACC1N4K7_9PEZI|nr:hypothetical protein NUW58_g8942 [Xylaria curta]
MQKKSCSTPAEDYAPLQDSPRQVPQGRPSQAKCGKRQSETHQVQKPFGDKPKKKAKLPDDGDNQGDGDDGSGSNGGGATFTATDAQKKSNCRWACPYCLVFAQMLTIAKFQSCRPPGYLKDRSLWSSRGVILLETILEVRASEAVNNGSIGTVQDFRPTHEQYMEMMREALLVITTESPGITQWVTSVSLEGLRTAVLDHDRTNQQAEAESADSEAVIPSEQTIGSAIPAVPTSHSYAPLSERDRGVAKQRPWGGDDASLQAGAGMASMPTDLDSPSMLTDPSDTPWLEFEDLVNYRHDTFTPPQ